VSAKVRSSWNQDVFAAMLRLLDARDPSYRD